MSGNLADVKKTIYDDDLVSAINGMEKVRDTAQQFIKDGSFRDNLFGQIQYAALSYNYGAQPASVQGENYNYTTTTLGPELVTLLLIALAIGLIALAVWLSHLWRKYKKKWQAEIHIHDNDDPNIHDNLQPK